MSDMRVIEAVSRDAAADKITEIIEEELDNSEIMQPYHITEDQEAGTISLIWNDPTIGNVLIYWEV